MGMLAGIAAMAVMSQNLIPVHIAFIPLLIPPLLAIMTQLRLDRRAVACIITFGLVTTYMYLPLGFGKIFLEDILLGNIAKAGLDVEGVKSKPPTAPATSSSKPPCRGTGSTSASKTPTPRTKTWKTRRKCTAATPWP